MNDLPSGPTRELIQSLLSEHATRFEFYGPDPEGGAMVIVDRGQTSPKSWQQEHWGIFVQLDGLNPEHIFVLCERETEPGGYCWKQLEPPLSEENAHAQYHDRSELSEASLFQAVLLARRVSDGVIALPDPGAE